MCTNYLLTLLICCTVNKYKTQGPRNNRKSRHFGKQSRLYEIIRGQLMKQIIYTLYFILSSKLLENYMKTSDKGFFHIFLDNIAMFVWVQWKAFGNHRSRSPEQNCIYGVITPNPIPLTTMITYLQKSYRSRISNHWATITACSVVPPIYKQSKKTYCHILF